MPDLSIFSWHDKVFSLSGCSPVPGSWHVISSRRKTLWGLPHAPNLQSSVSVYVSKMEVKLTWRQPGLTACHMLQGGRFASHGCEKPRKNLTGNQDFRTAIKSVFIQIIERDKFQRGMFRVMLIQHDKLGCEPVSLKRK